MSNFYLERAKRLAAESSQQAPASTQPVSLTVTQRPWWDTTPQQAPPVQPIQQVQNYPQQPPQGPTRATSARFTDKCPIELGGCGSSNYMPIENRWKCFNCGYPVVQSGSGVGVATGSDGKAAQPSRQVEHGGLSNQFNPGHIIGHV